MKDSSLEELARRFAALGDPTRLAIVHELVSSDRTALELQLAVGATSNLLAYHLNILEDAELISRCRSRGDGRRRYVCLRRDELPESLLRPPLVSRSALFICTHNSARSQLAAALWAELTPSSAMSAGTRPAERVHHGAVAAGRRAGLDLRTARPRHLDDVPAFPDLVVTVCDRAHEELESEPHWLHWSLADPIESGSAAAFDATVRELRERIVAAAGSAA